MIVKDSLQWGRSVGSCGYVVIVQIRHHYGAESLQQLSRFAYWASKSRERHAGGTAKVEAIHSMRVSYYGSQDKTRLLYKAAQKLVPLTYANE